MRVTLQDWAILIIGFTGSLAGFIYNGNPLSFGMSVLTGIAIVIALIDRFIK